MMIEIVNALIKSSHRNGTHCELMIISPTAWQHCVVSAPGEVHIAGMHLYDPQTGE